MGIKFEVEKDGHIVSSNGSVTLELNYLSWNGYPAKYDIRRWNGDEPYKGLTLSENELYELLEVVAKELGKKVISEELYDTLIDTYLDQIAVSDDNEEIEETEESKATIEHVERVLNVPVTVEPAHVRTCENCAQYRREDCAGLGLCDEYVYAPTISEEELAMWPDMGDASYMRTHNGWGRR